METDSDKPGKWQRRLIFAGAGLVAIFAAFVGWMVWKHRTLEQRLEEIRAAGDPASIRDLAPAPLPDGENAAVQLELITPELRQFAEEHGRFFRTDLGKQYDESRGREEPPSPEQLAAIRAILDKHPKIDAGLARAAACPSYASRVDFTVTHNQLSNKLIALTSDARTAARFIGWQMEVASGAGQRDEAVRQGIKLLKIAKLYEGEPSLLCFQINGALRMTAVNGLEQALSAGPVAAEVREQLDAELARQDALDNYARMLKTERAVAVTALDEQFRQVMPGAVQMFGPAGYYTASILDAYDELLPLARKPWHELYAMPSSAQPFKTPSGKGVMVDLLIPMLKVTYESANRDVAANRALRIANALAGHAADHGREASGLKDLSLPAEATLDPFAGKPLIAMPTHNGWLVYSVGKGGRDDGGKFKDQKDIGVALKTKRDKD